MENINCNVVSRKCDCYILWPASDNSQLEYDMSDTSLTADSQWRLGVSVWLV